MAVAAAELEEGTDESVARFYNSRVTHCEFLDDPDHYEFPRANWVLDNLVAGETLEIGAGNGGMTRLIAPKVPSLTAFDVSAPSLKLIGEMGLENVVTAQGLLETFSPGREFNCIILSEVIEHLREPETAVKKAYSWLCPGGTLLMTTPNGHWESDEHLHEFSMESLSAIVARTGCESFRVSYLRDRDNKRRWLVAKVEKPASEASPDDFFDRTAIARRRRKGS